MSKKVAFSMIVAAIFVVTMVSIAYAHERLVNGNFESGEIEPWNIANNASISITESPVRTGSYSGAISVINNAPNGLIGQCINISPPEPQGNHFTTSGWVYVPTNETNFNWARVRIQFWSSANCTGNLGFDESPNLTITPGQWSEFQLTSSEIPATAVSAMLWLRVARINQEEAVTVYWDDLALFDSGPTSVSILGLSTGSTIPDATGRWLLILGLILLTTLTSHQLLRHRKNQAIIK